MLDFVHESRILRFQCRLCRRHCLPGWEIKRHSVGDPVSSIRIILDDVILGDAELCSDVINTLAVTRVVAVILLVTNLCRGQIQLNLSQ